MLEHRKSSRSDAKTSDRVTKPAIDGGALHGGQRVAKTYLIHRPDVGNHTQTSKSEIESDFYFKNEGNHSPINQYDPDQRLKAEVICDTERHHV